MRPVRVCLYWKDYLACGGAHQDGHEGCGVTVLDLLEPDEFADYLARYYRAGLERFGVEWSDADLPTVLAAAAHMLRPASYLEIGVRRGRSMGIVSHIVPEAHLLGFDLWIPDYAGMDNPGLAFVQDELRKLGHTGCIELIEGDSHQTVPDYFKNNPDAFFDLITVDGDHTREGAKADLQAVLPRLKVGGALVFDDLVHPKHSYLRDVWREVIAGERRCAPVAIDTHSW